MAFVRVDDVLADLDLAETMDPALVALLARLAAAAGESGEKASEALDTFTVTVSPRGDIDVDTSQPNSFGDWVWAAGELARHVGPAHGDVNGLTRTVDDILGADEDGNTGDDEGAGGEPLEPAPAPVGRDLSQGISLDAPAGLTPSAPGGPHWAPWSAGAASAPTVATADVVEVYSCTGCLAVSDSAADFDGAAAAGMRCDECGGAVVSRRAVRSGGTLLLLPL